MKSSRIILTLGLAAYSATATSEDRIGYPVFVGFRSGKCTYQVQDMILTRKQLSKWMKALPAKDRQVDVVIASGVPARCIERAERAVHQAGFSDVEKVESGTREYPSGLPPAGQDDVTD